MEECGTVIFDRMKELVDERLIESDYFAYPAKWDSLITSVVSALQKEEPLETKLACVTVI